MEKYEEVRTTADVLLQGMGNISQANFDGAYGKTRMAG